MRAGASTSSCLFEWFVERVHAEHEQVEERERRQSPNHVLQQHTAQQEHGAPFNSIQSTHVLIMTSTKRRAIATNSLHREK
mgnify:CR=1 FL=1